MFAFESIVRQRASDVSSEHICNKQREITKTATNLEQYMTDIKFKNHIRSKPANIS